MTTKTYDQLLDELDSYNVRTKAATETYEENLVDIATAVTSCNDDADRAEAAASSVEASVYARTLTDFYAERAQNNERYAASGFVHHGKHGSENINEGLYTDTSTSNVLLIGGGVNGNSKTEQPTVNVAGSVSELSLLNDSSISTIKLSPAPDGTVTYDSSTGAIVQHADSATAFAAETATNKVVTERVDMFGLEAKLVEITAAAPEVLHLGLPQSQATTMGGLATSISSYDSAYFAAYEGDTTSIGKSIDFFNASEVVKTAILSDEDDHKIYFNKEGGSWWQWQVTQRGGSGSGNGDWLNTDSTQGDLEFDSFSPFLSKDGNAFTQSDEVGISEDGDGAYFYVIGTVPRLAFGLYHPSYNPEGCMKASDNAFWYNTAQSFTSKADCYDSAKLLASSGSILSANSGRPDGRYYDAIYASGQGGVIDDRPKYGAWDASSSEQASEVLQEVVSGEYRGREKLLFTKVFTSEATAISDGYTVLNNDNAAAVVAYIELDTTIESEFLQTDVVGDPANILLTDDLKDGWLGGWVPVIPDGTAKDFPLTRKSISTGNLNRVYTYDNGVAWVFANWPVDSVTNSRNYAPIVGEIDVVNYTAAAKQTKQSTNLPVLHGDNGLGNVLVTDSYQVSRGVLIHESLTGNIGKNDSASNKESNVIVKFDIESEIQSIEHYAIGLGAPNNSSDAIKVLPYQFAENNQANLGFVFRELEYSGGWGDDGALTSSDEHHKLSKPYGWIKNDI